MYIKIVSNFEACEFRENFGGHLADYVSCPNKRLRKTFLHPQVQARGCTRIEVSLHATPDLRNDTGAHLVQKALSMLDSDPGVFCTQPATKQWHILASHLDRCLCIAERPTGRIYLAWYANTKTSTIAGISVVPKGNPTDEKWERAIQWTISDFIFRCCPIFRIDILSSSNQSVDIALLRCYTKDPENKTILAACNRPCGIRSYLPEICFYLPETKHIPKYIKMA